MEAHAFTQRPAGLPPPSLLPAGPHCTPHAPVPVVSAFWAPQDLGFTRDSFLTAEACPPTSLTRCSPRTLGLAGSSIPSSTRHTSLPGSGCQTSLGWAFCSQSSRLCLAALSPSISIPAQLEKHAPVSGQAAPDLSCLPTLFHVPLHNQRTGAETSSSWGRQAQLAAEDRWRRP